MSNTPINTPNTPNTPQKPPQGDFTNIKQVLAHIPTYSKDASMRIYEKQLVNMRSVAYHQHTLRLLNEKPDITPEEKKRFVIKRVARELWTNFCVRGQKSAMLDHLHESLRKEFNNDFQFHYSPGSIELIIMETIDGETKPLDRTDQVNVINKAWEIALSVVTGYI